MTKRGGVGKVISVPAGEMSAARIARALGKAEGLGLGYPLVGLGSLTALNKTAALAGLLTGTYYLTLYVALVALVAYRRNRTAAIVIAVLSTVICGFKIDWTCPATFCYETAGIAAMAIMAFYIKPCPPGPGERRPTFWSGELRMPFISTRADGTVCHWDVEPSGDRMEELRVGEEIARIVVERIRLRKRCPEMTWIIKEMIDRGPERWSGIEVGFIQRMAQEGGRALIYESRLLKSQRGDQ